MDEHNTKIIRALDARALDALEANSAADTDVDHDGFLERVDADIRCRDLQVEVDRLVHLQTDHGCEFTQEDLDQLNAFLDDMVGPLYGAVSPLRGASGEGVCGELPQSLSSPFTTGVVGVSRRFIAANRRRFELSRLGSVCTGEPQAPYVAVPGPGMARGARGGFSVRRSTACLLA